jgi:hypothetical protein
VIRSEPLQDQQILVPEGGRLCKWTSHQPVPRVCIVTAEIVSQ